MKSKINKARVVAALLAASPALVLALASFAHPRQLALENAARWHDLHVALLVLFPLVVAPLWWLVRGQRLEVRWAVGLLAFFYAVFYGAQDAIAGVGLGAVMERASAPEDVDTIGRVAAGALFDVGNTLARIGVWCFLLACVLASLALVRCLGARAVPGALLLSGGAVSYLNSHVYWPRGTITMIVIAAGLAALAAASVVPAAAPARQRPLPPRARTKPAAGRNKPGPHSR